MPQLPPSLWGLVEEQVQPPERAEVKRILGEAAVELSLDLRAEVLRTLLEEQRRAARAPERPSLLAPAPPVRDLVQRELRQLLCGIHRKAALEGRDTHKAWARYSPRVLRFALGEAGNGAADLGAGLAGPPGLGNSSQNLNDIKHCLNVANIDQVIQHLRTLLKEECCALEGEIKALQRCLEDVYNSVAESSLAMLEPTLAELKEQKRAMKQELLGPPTPLNLCHSLQGGKSRDAGWQGLSRQKMLSSKTQDLPMSGQQPQESRSRGLLPTLAPVPPPVPASGAAYHQNRWGRRLQCRRLPCQPQEEPHAGTSS
ncbi:coiled-coil domain-containing protein 24 isoform X2 [Macrotis lagotis]|uniref:coiled-coil domain-containing protein 24 isoform X2 n=1 Tax=Macrotis lagotis TaxID=92651 RepID=UPI003D69F217